MLLNYDFLEFENDKKVRVIDDKLCVNILDFFGIGDEDDKIFTEAYTAEAYAITKDFTESSDFNEVWAKFSDITFSLFKTAWWQLWYEF